MRLLPVSVICFAAFNLLIGAAKAAPITIYDGSSVPQAQGWGRKTWDGGATVTVGLTTTEFNTQVGLTTKIDNYFSQTSAGNFVASISLSVISSFNTPNDAGLAFSVFGDPSIHFTSDPANNLMIGQSSVGWGDGAASVPLNTGSFHEYAIRYLEGNLDVYIDTPFGDIVAGTAVPVLSRANPVIYGLPGVIVFGDNSWTTVHNSRYVVDSVTFEALPEPTGTLLMAGGLAGILFRRKRRHL
ncbi:MAG: PEP-CTERM sorting domain-containing protein [Verrucomicrobiota bacterium]